MSNIICDIAGNPSFVRACRSTLLLFLFVFSASTAAYAAIPNQIQRIEIQPKLHFTRITVKLDNEPKFKVFRIPGNRLRIRLSDTDGTLFKSLRRYSDANIGGLLLSRRGDDMIVTFAIAPNRVGWRTVHIDGLPALSLDVGPLFIASSVRSPLPGRERIRNGAEKLLRDFDPPIKPEIPFVPTDPRALKVLLGDNDRRLFVAAEGALYKGKLTEAEDAFTQFTTGESRIRPLALYRLAEAQYRLQKYSQALTNFREAAQLWQEFLAINPAVMFYYGDSIARSGDLRGGRQLLAKLIVAHADKKYAPVLLVRMADVLARRGGEENAMAIYTTVAESFKDNKASQIALLKLADRAFLASGPDDYQALSNTYRDIAATTVDFDLREEATFKQALLESINGPADEALELVTTYQKKFPNGVYSTVIRDIREDLTGLVYQGNGDLWKEKPSELIKLATDNQEYLATVLKVPGFLPAVTTAFEKAGRPLDLIALYAGLLDRPWVSEENASYLTLQVADQAELLGDTMLARKILKGFLLRNPASPQSRWASERLGAIQFAAHEMAEVRTDLAWLLQKNEHAAFPVSYYYLGRSLWDSKDYARAAAAMESFITAAKMVKDAPPLLGDAYYVAAASYQAQGDRKRAVSLLETGLRQVPSERRDQFLYKLGELAAQDGRTQQAQELFGRVAREGKDPDWQRLARQALADSKIIAPTSSQSEKNQVK